MLRMVPESSTIRTRVGIFARMQISTSLRASSALTGLVNMPSTPSWRALPGGAETKTNGAGCAARAPLITADLSASGKVASTTQISAPSWASALVADAGACVAKSIGIDAIAAAWRHSSCSSRAAAITSMRSETRSPLIVVPARNIPTNPGRNGGALLPLIAVRAGFAIPQNYLA
jgi:hypothetical protein